MNNVLDFYKEKFEECSLEYKSVSLKLKWFGWYRFFSFVTIFFPAFILRFENWLTLFLTIGFLILFFFLIKKNIQLEKSKKKLGVLKKLVSEELLALDHSFSHFQNGKEFLDTDHFYSYDLDLFGEGSLFQFLNRTSTISGRQQLAEWLTSPSTNKNEIENKQKAIQELSLIPNWRIHFLTKGWLFEETEEISSEIHSWSEMELELNRPKTVKWLILLIPVFTLLSIVLSAIAYSNIFLYLMIFTQWLFIYFYWKKTTLFYKFFGRKSELLEKYMELLKFIEDHDFQTDKLKELQQKVLNPEKASKIIKQLKKLVKVFEYRQNMLVGFALNSLFLWDIRCVYNLWNWHRKHHKKLAVWLNAVSEMDALVSLGNFANNHKEFTYPEIHEGGFSLYSEKLGHPLLHPGKRICNDIEINGWSKVMIISGANMAGKSTFLRTVGVNLILGRLGAPVCAKKMRFTPIGIYTNMRTTDSLLKDESYFFAELKRIKGVLDRLEKGERIFVILDEMLKGTNSVDKLNGSKELIRKLIEYKSISLIATHDLKLSEMENEFPQIVFNKCFEIKIENDELVFDFLLSDGVTKTMNATFLMKKMGII